jgi:NADH-quinone oxidoreductase subunit B
VRPYRYDGAIRVWLADLGLACCAVEVAAAAAGRPDVLRPETDEDPEPELDVLLVSGTVTDVLAPLVVRRHREIADRAAGGVRVVSVGACADAGGPYWDSYAVTKGVDQLLPVDTWIPGCPPRPEALLSALAELAGRDQRAVAGRS